MKNYYKNADYPLDSSSSKNSYENNEKYGNEDNINMNTFPKYNNYGNLNKNAYKEENNSKEDIAEINNEDKINQYSRGKFRFINSKAEKEKNIKKRNIYDNEKNNYSTQNTNDKSNNNNSNKITNNICIIINKPEVQQNKDNFDYLNLENQNKIENKTINAYRKNKNKSYEFRNSKNNKITPIRYSKELDNYRKNSYLETEPNKKDKFRNLYKTKSSDVSRNRNNNKSFNKLIEEKRILLGIPIYKTEFQKFNTNTNTKDDIFKHENRNINKILLYKRRQDEILRNYEKKNILNQKIREYIKNNNQKKNPLRIIYDDINIYNIFENDRGLDKNHSGLNNTFIFKNIDSTNHNRRNYSSHDNKPNKTPDDKNYLKSKVQYYKQKEKASKLKKPTNNNIRTHKELIKFKSSPINQIETPEDKKVYDNNYYSKILPKLINNNENESQKNSNIKESNTNSDNKNIDNFSISRKYNKRNVNVNLNTYNSISPYIHKPIVYSFPTQNNGSDMQILKKRHNSITVHVETNNIKHKKINEIKKLEKGQSKFPKKRKYENNVTRPGRAISALRRINQTIENYKKGINRNEESLKMKIDSITLY